LTDDSRSHSPVQYPSPVSFASVSADRKMCGDARLM
jgi:hypothetical protein